GNVNTVRPTVDAKYFRPSPFNKKHILAFHAMSSLLTGYGGRVAPPFSRTYIGGGQDVPGVESWGSHPGAYVLTSATNVPVLNADGTQRTQKVINNGVITQAPATMTIPYYQLVFPGGDLQFVGNFEYRINIVGPVTLAPFVDFGIDKIAIPSQLRM